LYQHNQLNKEDVNHLVLIQWYDSAYAHGWCYDDDLAMPLPLIETVGWVRRLDEISVDIVSTKGEKKGFLNSVAIPLGVIISVKRLDPDFEQSVAYNRNLLHKLGDIT
jgi:hypothetical protein